MAIKKAKIFTITSVKGGVGKTIFSLGLAGLLEKRNLRTLVVDFDLYSSGIAFLLNTDDEKDIYIMSQDMRNNHYEAFENYTIKYDDYIDILASPKDPRFASKIDSKYIDLILDKARTRYDVILVDTNHILTTNNLITMDYSDNILYLLTDDLIDLKNMRTMGSIYSDMEKENYTLILNRALGKKKRFSEYEVKHMIDDDINVILNDDFYISDMTDYLLSGKIFTLDKKVLRRANKTIKELDNMLDKLLESE